MQQQPLTEAVIFFFCFFSNNANLKRVIMHVATPRPAWLIKGSGQSGIGNGVLS
jgi:hypothetical protein